ncbi:hypothetical protein BDV10DRAFT_152340 [Aspergillus recurvatus]
MSIPRTRPGRARSASSTTAAEASPESNVGGSVGTVVQPCEHQHHRAQQHTALPNVGPGGLSPNLNIPFDMLGFIGEITSDFQQKHLDLTNGETIVASLAAMQEIDGGHFHDQRQVTWGAEEEIGDSGIGVLPDSNSPRRASEEVWEERLLQHFCESEAPPTMFAPVDLEWRYVKDAIFAESTRSAPGCRALLLSVYCYSDIHMAWTDGAQPRLGPSYHEQASSEIYACLLGDPHEALLKRVFTSVLLLMLAEVCPSLSTP